LLDNFLFLLTIWLEEGDKDESPRHLADGETSCKIFLDGGGEVSDGDETGGSGVGEREGDLDDREGEEREGIEDGTPRTTCSIILLTELSFEVEASLLHSVLTRLPWFKRLLEILSGSLGFLVDIEAMKFIRFHREGSGVSTFSCEVDGGSLRSEEDRTVSSTGVLRLTDDLHDPSSDLSLSDEEPEEDSESDSEPEDEDDVVWSRRL